MTTVYPHKLTNRHNNHIRNLEPGSSYNPTGGTATWTGVLRYPSSGVHLKAKWHCDHNHLSATDATKCAANYQHIEALEAEIVTIGPIVDTAIKMAKCLRSFRTAPALFPLLGRLVEQVREYEKHTETGT